MTASLVLLHAYTPLHSGAGQGVESIDLPITRERATGLPVVPGSSIKGCLRDTIPLTDEEKAAVFGPETRNADAHAGALRVGDARLTLLPVRSLTATFVWAACPFVLKRLKRDADACGIETPEVKPVAKLNARITAGTGTVKFLEEKQEVQKLVLEELDLKVEESGGNAKEWADWFCTHLFRDEWKVEVEKRFAIVDDDSFTFLAEFGTEVNAHIRIDDKTGTVEDGALWYQEALPAETVLTSIMHADASKSALKLSSAKVMDKAKFDGVMQIGGKANTGMGVVRLVVVKGDVR
jgi:CRISPR-associated protein Cmr4